MTEVKIDSVQMKVLTENLRQATGEARDLHSALQNVCNGAVMATVSNIRWALESAHSFCASQLGQTMEDEE